MVARFQAIIPKPLKEKEFRFAFLNGLRKTGRDGRSMYNDTVSTFSARSKPRFDFKVSLAASKPTVEFDLDGSRHQVENYLRLDQTGAAPHLIVPRRAKRLMFSTGYTAKTSPGVIRAGSGGPSGGSVFADEVRHPGFPPRRFTEQIARKLEPEFNRNMQQAMNEGVRKSGHAL